MSPQHSTADVHDRREWITLEDLASGAGVQPLLIERLVDLGLLESAGPPGQPPVFLAAAALRLHAIQRIRRDIGVNLAGVGVILDLLERVRALERELERLRLRE
jgi:hypothetical protein